MKILARTGAKWEPIIIPSFDDKNLPLKRKLACDVAKRKNLFFSEKILGNSMTNIKQVEKKTSPSSDVKY